METGRNAVIARESGERHERTSPRPSSTYSCRKSIPRTSGESVPRPRGAGGWGRSSARLLALPERSGDGKHTDISHTIAKTLQNPPFRCSRTCGNTLSGRKGLNKHGPRGEQGPCGWGKREQGTAPGRQSVRPHSPSKGTHCTRVKQARTFRPTQLIPPSYGVLSGWAGGPRTNYSNPAFAQDVARAR